ncbi:MAG: hypothetical protein H0V18_14240, partial [Pyrinomonadaceae bacterium]|nr:hypothetical protein [Pyrinomonadaceae bacterium]
SPLTVEAFLRNEFPDHWRQAIKDVGRTHPAGQSNESLPKQNSTRTTPETHQFDDDEAESDDDEAESLEPPTDEGLDPIPFEVLLTRLAAALRRGVLSTEAIIRPTRVNAQDAERTFLQRATAHFFLTHGGNLQPELIAHTVTAILDLDPPLDADLVRKNVKQICDFYWDPDDDYGENPDE